MGGGEGLWECVCVYTLATDWTAQSLPCFNGCLAFLWTNSLSNGCFEILLKIWRQTHERSGRHALVCGGLVMYCKLRCRDSSSIGVDGLLQAGEKKRGKPVKSNMGLVMQARHVPPYRSPAPRKSIDKTRERKQRSFSSIFQANVFVYFFFIPPEHVWL